MPAPTNITRNRVPTRRLTSRKVRPRRCPPVVARSSRSTQVLVACAQVPHEVLKSIAELVLKGSHGGQVPVRVDEAPCELGRLDRRMLALEVLYRPSCGVLEEPTNVGRG